MNHIKRAKTFALKSGALADNHISGVASVAGVLDTYNDVILPGAFAPETLAAFLSTGFVAANHDWREIVAMPTVAEVRGNDLYTEAEFHSTDDAQALRTKCAERIDRGLAVGLSIGFTMRAGDYKSFANGAALLKWAGGAGYDLSALDSATIGACVHRCQAILRVEKLYEYSIVSAPANPDTWATEVKRAPVDETELRYFKGEYLGDYAEAEAAWSALCDLTVSLKYRPLWDAVFARGECSGMDTTARLEHLAGAYAEYTRISLAVASALLPLMPESPADGESESDDYIEMGAKLRAIVESRVLPAASIFPDSPVLPAGTLGDHADAALAVAKAFSGRLAGLHALRTREGRSLSHTNQERAAHLRAALLGCVEHLEGMLQPAATDLAPLVLEQLRARQNYCHALAELP